MGEHTEQGALAQLPDEMLRFILDAGAHAVPAPRLGRLLAHGRTPISTPHYAAPTSRGVVPHIAPDIFEKRTAISAVYSGLEDSHRSCVVIERSTTKAPVLALPATNGESPLRTFTAVPRRCLSILGPRRVPRIQCPAQSTDISIPICTSVGFRKLELNEYNDATQTLKPDVTASLADIADADRISLKRTEKMGDRTHAWLRDTLERSPPNNALFATVLPLENVQQRLYLSDIHEEYISSVLGLILHDPQTSAIIPPSIQHLPRVCLSSPATPHDLLAAIALSVDLITVPFVSQVTEQGIAFTFAFPASPNNSEKLPLGLDMWLPSHASDASPLSPGCECYACTRHHRAYLHHLLQAKEMLAWTLLQIHNFHVLDSFFAAIRSSIAAGTFEADADNFRAGYEQDFMAGEGKERGPRLRGYQMKSAGRGEDKKREKVWGRFEGSEPMSGFQSPAAVGESVENDAAREVVEAVESGEVCGEAELGESKR